MAKKNPNGYGSVVHLKGNRSRPYCAKVTIYDEAGRGRQIPIGYAKTRKEAQIILADYNNKPWDVDREQITLADLYQRWAEVKFPNLSLSLQRQLRAAFKYCVRYYGVKYRSLKAYQMQDCINTCPKGYGTKQNIKKLFRHLDLFAFELDIIDKMYSQLITPPPTPETSRTPFTTEHIEKLWEIQNYPYVDSVLIYLYTGFRLMELLDMKKEQINLEEWYFKGGSKTAAGKNRIVPIHERIRPLVVQLMEQEGTNIIQKKGSGSISYMSYYTKWRRIMQKIGAEGKTPHEARHTFETLLDNAGGNRRCIDLLMGHSSQDIGNRVYNHKTIDQLRETIALLN